MKKTSLITTFIFFILIDVKAQSLPSEADLYWESLQQFIDVPNIEPQLFKAGYYANEKQYLEAKIKKATYFELHSRLLRDFGIEFWRRFPNDPRRFRWFLNTCFAEPAYFANIREGVLANLENRYVISLDTASKNKWNSLYSYYLKEYLASNEVSKSLFLTTKLRKLFNPYWRNSDDEKFDFQSYTMEFVSYFKQGLIDEKSILLLNVIYENRKQFGLTDTDIERFIKTLKAVNIPVFLKVAKGIENEIKLKYTPLKMRAQSTDGRLIDLNDYKGKIVLVDFWSPGCSVCIDKMPEIKSVYDKYRENGFEVISACLFYNGRYYKNEFNKIMDIHHKIGATWPLILLDGNEGGIGKKIFETYGWSGVPHLLLLDREGTLIIHQGELFNSGGLEKVVKQYLANNSIQNQKRK